MRSDLQNIEDVVDGFDGSKYEQPAVTSSGLLAALVEAVAAKRAAKAAYDAWYDAHDHGRFPSKEAVNEECRLRTALGHAERAVIAAGEAVVNAANNFRVGALPEELV